MMVSIIVTCYNGEKYINRCINSLLNQNYKNYEIIVVNDGSTDGSLNELNKFKNQITVISQRNKGVAGAKNAGIKAARGTHIVFVDIDDYVERDYLSILANGIGDDMCCFSGYKNRNGNDDTIFNPGSKVINVLNDSDVMNTVIPRLTSGILKTSFVRDIMFDEECTVAYEDFLFQIKALSKLHKVKFVDGTPYIFVHNCDSVTHSLDDNKIAKRVCIYIHCIKEITLILKDKKVLQHLVSGGVNSTINYYANCRKRKRVIDNKAYSNSISILLEIKTFMDFKTRVVFFMQRHLPKLTSFLFLTVKRIKT